MTDNVKRIYAIPSDDPADVILDLLAKTGHLGEGLTDKRIGVPDDVLDLGVLVCSVSPLWKQTTAALSTGPLQYAAYSVERAKARVMLVKQLKDFLGEYYVMLPSFPPQYVVKNLFDEAGVTWDSV